MTTTFPNPDDFKSISILERHKYLTELRRKLLCYLTTQQEDLNELANRGISYDSK